MNTVSLLVAWRYLLGSSSERTISWMVIICFISIVIGSFSLAVVMAIMNGFEKETYKKLQGIHASITIDAGGEQLNWPAIKTVLDTEFSQIIASTPTTSKQVIVQLPESDDMNNVVFLRAIDPLSYAHVTTLEETLISTTLKRQNLQDTVQDDYLLIGASLAKALDVGQGDSIKLLFVPEDRVELNRIHFDHIYASIGGIFHTGIDELDNHIVYCSFTLLEKLFPESGITEIDLQLDQNAHEEEIIQKIKERLDLHTYSWKQLYPALVSALKLEKYAMFFILSLIIIVASMNIISLLFMQIIQKRGDIAILKALGMSTNGIRTIFMSMGIFIALLATITGLTAALIVCILLKNYPFIQLPDAYYVTHLPVSIEWQSFCFIFLTIMMLSFLSTWIATYKISRISIASVLRFYA